MGSFTTDYYVNPADRQKLAEPLERDGKADNVLLELRHPSGGTFWARASARLVSWEGEPAVLTVFDDISEELGAERALRGKRTAARRAEQRLTALTARHADPNDRFEDRLRGILEVAAATLQVERVSMWRFDAGPHRHRLRRPVSPQPAPDTSRARSCRAQDFPPTSPRSNGERVDRGARCQDRRADARVRRRRISNPNTSAPCWTCRCARAPR